MTGRREILRQRAQLRRDIAKKTAQQGTAERLVRVGAVVDQIRSIMSHEQFVALALAHGIDSMPQRLLPRDTTPNDTGYDESHVFAENVMDFVVAWRFVSPMLQETPLKDFIEARWPGFVSNFKDVFITLVADGPFLGERKKAVRRG